MDDQLEFDFEKRVAYWVGSVIRDGPTEKCKIIHDSGYWKDIIPSICMMGYTHINDSKGTHTLKEFARRNMVFGVEKVLMFLEAKEKEKKCNS